MDTQKMCWQLDGWMNRWMRWWQSAIYPGTVLTTRASPWLPLCPASVYFVTCLSGGIGVSSAGAGCSLKHTLTYTPNILPMKEMTHAHTQTGHRSLGQWVHEHDCVLIQFSECAFCALPSELGRTPWSGGMF